MTLRTLVAVWALAGVTVSGQGRGAPEHWVGTWSTALVALPSAAPEAAAPAAATAAPNRVVRLTLHNQTLRQVVRATVGGSRVRVVVSNVFGTAPLVIGAAHVGVSAKAAGLVEGTGRTLQFGGQPAVTVPAAAVMMSDPVDLVVPRSADLAVDLFLPNDVTAGPSPLSYHSVAVQTNYVSTTGNHVGASQFPVLTTTNSWYLLSRVEVVAPDTTRGIVTFGDSITDGTRSTPNSNRRWPNVLAERLAKLGEGRYAVMNAGISGNRLLSEGTQGFGMNALSRFDRDVLVQSGVTHVVVLEGINDIGFARQSPDPGAAELIAAHRQLIARARARGLKIIGATLTPFEGAAYFTPEGEKKRAAVNEWLRTSGAYDAVIDFDQVVRDPGQPSRILKAYDSGDALHPSDAGYAAMANAVELALFR